MPDKSGYVAAQIQKSDAFLLVPQLAKLAATELQCHKGLNDALK